MIGTCTGSKQAFWTKGQVVDPSKVWAVRPDAAATKTRRQRPPMDDLSGVNATLTPEVQTLLASGILAVLIPEHGFIM